MAVHRLSLLLTAATSLLILLPGCGHHPAHEGHAEHGAEHEGHGPTEQSHGPGAGSDGAELQLVLNDGQKWQVDGHTRTTAARIMALAAEAIHSIDAARDMGEKLDREVDVLIKGCTMTGAAHDQLHVFLLALLPQIAVLQEKTDLHDLQQARGEIGSILGAYRDHFE